MHGLRVTTYARLPTAASLALSASLRSCNACADEAIADDVDEASAIADDPAWLWLWLWRGKACIVADTL